MPHNQLAKGGLGLAAVTLIVGMAPYALAWAGELDEIQALADRGQTEKALRQLEALPEGRSQQPEAQLLRGVLLADLGRTEAAERAFRALGQSYAGPEPDHNLAVMQAWRGRRRIAVAELMKIVDRYPQYAMAARNLASIRRQEAGGGFDPLSPDASRVALELTPRLGSFATAAPTPQLPQARPEPAEPAAAEAETAPVVAAPETGPEPQSEAGATPAETETRPAEAAEPLVPRRRELIAAPAAPASVPSATPPTAATADADTTADGDLRAQVEPMVQAWAAAWSEQRVKEYLGFYASDFQATGFPSRDAWETTRRQRVAAPSFIEVEVELDSMTVQRTSPGEASVSFVQHYRSDRYVDTVRKTLELVREDGSWRIRSEASE